MKNRQKVDSKEIGLEIGLIIGKHLFKTEHLHYGYWTDDLSIDLINFPQAQENYGNFLISQIPEGTKTILDVGCGVGKLALNLMNRGHEVDCVSPSPVFTEHARDLLGSKSYIFECRYEDLQTDNRYDVVLFSESFQYIDLEKALQNSIKFLNNGGYLLICDFFKKNAKGECVLGGGHELEKFYDVVTQNPFKPIKDIDITEQTAPTLDMVNNILTEVGHPIWNLVDLYLDSNYHLISKFLHWKFRKKIEKINRKYFSGERNAENFAIFKSYRLLLYQKVST